MTDDEYHKNLMKHSLSILESDGILGNKIGNTKNTQYEKSIESEPVFSEEKKSTTEVPQYFYDISTNLFIPPSL